MSIAKGAFGRSSGGAFVESSLTATDPTPTVPPLPAGQQARGVSTATPVAIVAMSGPLIGAERDQINNAGLAGFPASDVDLFLDITATGVTWNVPPSSAAEELLFDGFVGEHLGTATGTWNTEFGNGHTAGQKQAVVAALTGTRVRFRPIAAPSPRPQHLELSPVGFQERVSVTLAASLFSPAQPGPVTPTPPAFEIVQSDVKTAFTTNASVGPAVTSSFCGGDVTFTHTHRSSVTFQPAPNFEPWMLFARYFNDSTGYTFRGTGIACQDAVSTVMANDAAGLFTVFQGTTLLLRSLGPNPFFGGNRFVRAVGAPGV